MKSQAPERPELAALVKRSVEAFNRLPKEEQKALRREQRISFVYGNVGFDNPRITREMVEKLVDEGF